MYFRIKNVTWELTFGFFAAIAVFLLFDRSGLLLWTLAVIFLHEIGHLLVIFLCGGRPQKIVLEPFGVRIEEKCVCRSFLAEAAVLFAGPGANILLFLILYALYGLSLPVAGVISLLTGLLNLLPIGLLDGGRIVENLLSIFLPYQKVQAVCTVISFIFLIPLFILGIVMLCHAGHNFTLLLLCMYLLITIIFKTKLQNF